VSCAVVADAIPEGAYISGKLGAHSMRSIKNSNLPIVSTVTIEMTDPNSLGLRLKRGRQASLAIGTKVCDFRFEFEGLWMRSQYNDFNMYDGQYELFTPLLTGSTTVMSGLGNIYYDLNICGDFLVPYVGVGAGVARVKNHIEFELMEGQLKGNMSNTTLAYHGTAGVSLHLTESVSATLDYRYFATSKVKAFEKSLKSNLVNLGLVYRF
jgi:opacity protein-like surface antigen